MGFAETGSSRMRNNRKLRERSSGMSDAHIRKKQASRKSLNLSPEQRSERRSNRFYLANNEARRRRRVILIYMLLLVLGLILAYAYFNV